MLAKFMWQNSCVLNDVNHVGGVFWPWVGHFQKNLRFQLQHLLDMTSENGSWVVFAIKEGCMTCSRHFSPSVGLFSEIVLLCI